MLGRVALPLQNRSPSGEVRSTRAAFRHERLQQLLRSALCPVLRHKHAELEEEPCLCQERPEELSLPQISTRTTHSGLPVQRVGLSLLLFVLVVVDLHLTGRVPDVLARSDFRTLDASRLCFSALIQAYNPAAVACLESRSSSRVARLLDAGLAVALSLSRCESCSSRRTRDSIRDAISRGPASCPS